MTKTFEASQHLSSTSTSTAAADDASGGSTLNHTPIPSNKNNEKKKHVNAPQHAAAEKSTTATNTLSEEKSVTNLDEKGLRALLDEAINYKTPKDREGKSKLFNSLLSDAEDEIRKKTAYNASGPARHFSTTAKKRQRQRRQPSSISENLTHGGSLNDLAKEELYESTKMQRPKTVSTRQREGGSLPCNVNAGASHVDVDKQYFKELSARQQEQRSKATVTTVDAYESQRLLDDTEANIPIETRNIFTAKANVQITQSDDAVTFSQLQCNVNEARTALTHAMPTQQFGLINPNPNANLANFNAFTQKKLDENGNALSAGTAKARKSKHKKTTENVMKADQIKGHRADIIDNIDMLVSFIDGTETDNKPKPNKKLHKQNTLNSDEKSKKRQRKKSTSMLQKSTSMEEISTTKLEDFAFNPSEDANEKTPLRPTKSNVERQIFANSTSAENLEIADFIYVTKKKKSKKRRNSLGTGGRTRNQQGNERPAEFHGLRVSSSSSPRRKSASDSENSNSNSDNESVRSAPAADTEGEDKSKISYADIAKSSDRPRWNRPPSERRKSEKSLPSTPIIVAVTVAPVEEKHQIKTPEIVVKESPPVAPPVAAAAVAKETDTDLASLQDWPEIRNNKVNNNGEPLPIQAMPIACVNAAVQSDWPSIINGARQPPPVAVVAVDKLEKVEKHKKVNVKNGKTVQQVPVFNHQPQAQDKEKQERERNVKQQQQPDIKEKTIDFGLGMEHPDDIVLNNTQQVIQQVVSEHQQYYKMPPNIRDVQSIEKMQMRSLQQHQNQQETTSETLPPAATATATGAASAPVAISHNQSHAHSHPHSSVDKHRPAVVILSSGGDKHVTDITFGFGINEQLLSGDVCADFVSRFYLPDETPAAMQIDKLVNYIGSEWQEVLVQTQTGKVKYYTDELS